MLRKASKFSFASIHTKIAIIGAGSGGLNIAAQISRRYDILPSHVRLFDPSKFHFYQPAFTMIGGGLSDPSIAQRRMDQVLPKHVAWTNYKVVKINPDQNSLETEDGYVYTYDHLIVAAGMVPNFSSVPGLLEAIEDPTVPVASIYGFKQAQKTWEQIKKFSGGKAIFTEPVPPIKCGGAPQKILLLANDQWKGKADIEFCKAGDVCFGVKKYSEALVKIHEANKTKINLKTNLISVDGKNKKAIFKNLITGDSIEKDFDFLHVVPPHSPHKFVVESGLTNEAGYVDVDKQTLRHNKYPNVWAVGDCSSLPTSKTAAAVMTQVPILLKNLVQVFKNLEPTAKYNGYTSCPIFVGGKKLMLAEFKYDNVVEETFLTNQEVPRRSFYWLKKSFFPFAYWHLVTRGVWHGKDGINIHGYA